MLVIHSAACVVPSPTWDVALGLRLLAVALAVSAGALLPATALAHPLGNFTINHYAGLTIRPDRIDLDVVIDMAEIPAFQERQRMDADGDGTVERRGIDGLGGDVLCGPRAAPRRRARWRCARPTAPGAASITFPAGAGGLSTFRLECAYGVAVTPALTDQASRITFADTSYLERLGWREIVATAAGTILDTHGLPATSPSAKLTAYPADLIATPLDVRRARDRCPAWIPPARRTVPSPATVPHACGGRSLAGPPTAGAVPGGVAGEVPAIFRTADLTPFVVLASLADRGRDRRAATR